MTQLLITGFSPFDGRKVNGSWIAAQTYEAAHHLEIPVVWGEPMQHLETAISTIQPEVIISLGEGHEGYFAVETLARNQRKHRQDNLAQFPTSDIAPGGADQRYASIDAAAVCATLSAQDIPIQVSEDAGQFICEETLYCLETLKLENPFIKKVIFTHLPPFGTSVNYQNTSTKVDETLLKDFLNRLVEAVQKA